MIKLIKAKLAESNSISKFGLIIILSILGGVSFTVLGALGNAALDLMSDTIGGCVNDCCLF